MLSQFHIHIDAMVCSDDLMSFLPEGFYEMNFIGHPKGWRHYEPKRHMTLKPEGHMEYLRLWELTKSGVQRDKTFRGYIEGEVIPERFVPTEKPYTPGVPVPFKITRRKLRGKKYDEGFRRTEIHLTLDKDASDPRLIESLLEAGFYGAYLPKEGYTALVLTAQAVRRPTVLDLTEALCTYLDEVGGVVRGKIKEEVILDWWSQKISPQSLPEVIDTITYL